MKAQGSQLEESQLWRLTFGTPQIDPQMLASAVEREASRDDIDYRTRLLIRDSIEALRSRWQLLTDLHARYGLRLTHFQFRYPPDDWKMRVRSLGSFANLDVFAVDPLDIFVRKLFSARAKDRDDLRSLASHFAKDEIASRLSIAGTRFLADPKLRENAEKNWYIVFGDALPHPS